jgi:hypothetical protein
MAMSLTGASERSIAAVPRAAKIVLAVALIVQIAWHAATPKPVASASALGAPPPLSWLRAASLGEQTFLAQVLVLYLQAFDNQPGLSIPFRDLDYGAVQAWLETALALDPHGQYPLMMAAHLYAQVQDEAKQRRMLEFLHREFLRDPNRRWRWLAHAAIVAKHRLKDLPLALRYAEEITLHARGASSWARQMRIFIREDMGEAQSAAIMLGGLLDSGEVSEPAEINFLTQRLQALRSDEKSTKSSGSR